MAFCFNAIFLLLLALLPCSGSVGARPATISSVKGEYAPDNGPEASIARSRQVTFRFLDRVPVLGMGYANEPAPPHPGHSAGSLGAILLALEHRALCLAGQYLEQVAGNCHGLRGSDVIYPFHYFW